VKAHVRLEEKAISFPSVSWTNDRGRNTDILRRVGGRPRRCGERRIFSFISATLGPVGRFCGTKVVAPYRDYIYVNAQNSTCVQYCTQKEAGRFQDELPTRTKTIGIVDTAFTKKRRTSIVITGVAKPTLRPIY